MHIEISAGGLSGGIAVASFQNGMKKYISGTDGMISSFKAVKTKTYNLNGGGPGQHLSGAMEDISQRIRTEENRKRGAETVQEKSNSFLDLAVRVDKSVANMVKQDRKELYGQYPGLKPSPGQWVKDRLSDAWNWLCKTGKDIANAADKAWNAVKDTVKKAWDSIVTFYEEHKELIGKIVGTVLIVVGAVAAIAAVIATGGLALAPLIGAGLAALGISATTAASIAAVVSAVVGITAIVSTLGASTMNIIDIWADKSDDATFQTWKKIFNVVSIVTNTLYSIGNLYNAYKGTTGAEYLAENRPPSQPLETPKIPEMSQVPESEAVDYSRPTHFRKGMKDTAWDNYKNEEGVVRDWRTGEIINKDDPWHMGHKPGYEFWKHQESARQRGISRQQFLDEYMNPDHFRPELPASNWSHAGEAPPNVYYGP